MPSEGMPCSGLAAKPCEGMPCSALVVKSSEEMSSLELALCRRRLSAEQGIPSLEFPPMDYTSVPQPAFSSLEVPRMDYTSVPQPAFPSFEVPSMDSTAMPGQGIPSLEISPMVSTAIPGQGTPISNGASLSQHKLNDAVQMDDVKATALAPFPDVDITGCGPRSGPRDG